MRTIWQVFGTPGGFIEWVEHITDHLEDGRVVEVIAVESEGVGATVQHAHSPERRIRWRVGHDGQRVTLRSPEGCLRTWLHTDHVRAIRASSRFRASLHSVVLQ